MTDVAGRAARLVAEIDAGLSMPSGSRAGLLDRLADAQPAIERDLDALAEQLRIAAALQ